MQTINDVPMILRREIEIRMIAPFLEAFSRELGRKNQGNNKSHDLPNGGRVWRRPGKSHGREIPTDIRERVVPIFEAGGAWGGIHGGYGEKVSWDITNCAYVDIYRKIGRPDLASCSPASGTSFCSRD
jgi:hypothetical protein